MIVDLIRNDLGRLAAPGGVAVERLFEIEPYPTVWQMTSTVTARAPNLGIEQILRAMFPCGSITGAPKIRAMQIAAELECARRGLYCGAIGWLAPDGDLRLNVAIRTLVMDDAGGAVYGVGSGVVHDSIPGAERRECTVKARVLGACAPDFALIETLRCEPETAAPYPLLALHLDRLAESAVHFGFVCRRDQIVAELRRRAAGLPPGAHRVRLLLHADGGTEIAATPLGALPARPKLALAQEALDSRDPFLRHKTTRRARYDSALQVLAAQPGYFDLLFENERGELCEGARSNLFLRFGRRLHTPPLACGLLPGIMRRALLDNPGIEVVQRPLTRADLARADAILLANALRGLFEVELAPMPAQVGTGGAELAADTVG